MSSIVTRQPPVCVLRTDGTNCDEETAYAFELAGASPQRVHVNQLRARSVRLSNFPIVAIPGGFSNGDDVASGKILAVELLTFFQQDLAEFVERGGLILGICNGFQVLVRTGLLPFGRLGEQSATLATNRSGKFECRWTCLLVERSPCVFLRDDLGQGLPTEIELQVAHMEGRFEANEEVLRRIEDAHLVVLRYGESDGDGRIVPTSDYPHNPNNSQRAIAGICDPTGRIFGLMPHPERNVLRQHHPEWRSLPSDNEPDGLCVFENAVRYWR